MAGERGVIHGTLMHAAEQMQGRLTGADTEFFSVSTDTRSLRAGNLFVALRGPRFDGDRFVDRARELGAAGAVVHAIQTGGLAQIAVGDTRLALGRLARRWRERFAMPLVAVTGSNGKTTVKNMLVAILGQMGAVLATRGNLNNEIGVPLTLLELDSDHDYAVVEMGANHLGEIAYLTGLAMPTVGVVTNAAAAHLEGFGDLDKVACAKGELFARLDADATAIINQDDAYAEDWRGRATGTVLTFGRTSNADFHTGPIETGTASGSRFELCMPGESVQISLAMVGTHNISNALAAAAAAWAVGARGEAIRHGLESVRNVAGRLQRRQGHGDSVIFDDSYNANPDSLEAAMRFLAALSGDSWLVLGDMYELGDTEQHLHAQAGRKARELGIGRLYTVGQLSRHAALAFGKGARHFDEVEGLIESLREDLDNRVNVLVKASRGMRLERVVAAITVDAGQEQER